MDFSDKELLNYALENGIIDRSTIQTKIEMNERKKYIEKHTYSIWQGKDGKFYTYLPDEKSNRGKKLVKRTSEKSLEDSIVNYYKSTELEPTVEYVFGLWLEQKFKYNEITKQTYDKYKTNFKRFCSSISNKKIRYIDDDYLEEYIKNTISELNLTSKAYSDMRLLINGIFKYAKKHGYTNLSITNFLGDIDISKRSFKKVHVDPSDKVFFDYEEKQIENYILNDRETIVGLGILLAFDTGLRAGELAGLRWTDIRDNKIRVSSTEVRYKDDDGNYIFEVREFPKTDAGFREIILTKSAQDVIKRIKRLNPFNEFVFVKNGKRVKGQAFTRRLYTICDELHLKKRSLHKARMTYSTKLIDGNVPESVIINQMGHTDIETTKRYYYYNNKTQEEMENAINFALNSKR